MACAFCGDLVFGEHDIMQCAQALRRERAALTSEVERLKSALLIRDAEVSVLLQRDADLAHRISALTKAPATEVHGGSPCCNPDCRGTWGANCPHCHRLDHECTPENGERDRALAGWRCFHCGAFFEKRALAENHFGYTGSAPPLCGAHVPAGRQPQHTCTPETDLHCEACAGPQPEDGDPQEGG